MVNAYTQQGSENFESVKDTFRDLAPEIFRQRMVIEGYPSATITAEQIKNYLSGLSEVLSMTALCRPVTDRSDKFGWAGWIHWEESGAHVYAWEQPRLFLSVDIYTCSPFDEQAALKYTADFFQTAEIVGRAV